MNDPARTRQAARQRHVGALQQALSCVSRAVWITAPRVRGQDDELALELSENPVALQLRGGGRLYLVARQFCRITAETHPHAAWTARGEGYLYAVQFGSDAATECLAWHWHPGTRPDTHLHMAATHPIGGDLSHLHVPTGWMEFAGVLRFLIGEMDVQPLRADWNAILRPAHIKSV